MYFTINKNDISNNINFDASLNTINNTLSNKQNIFTCITPLIKMIFQIM